MAMDFGNQIGQGAGQFLSGLFGNSGAPYEDAAKEYEKYANRGIQYQQPFFNAGTQAIGNYQNWSNSQKNPTDFINNLMNSYQQSPYARFQMQQGQRAADNAASASGLLGSSPYMQASQDYAQNISNQDMQNWLANVLGINTQYGQSQQNLMAGGQGAANALSGIQQQLGENMGQMKYNEIQGRNADTANMFNGGANLISGGLGFLFP